MAVYKSALPVRHENLGDIVVGIVGSDNTSIIDVLTVNSAYGTTPKGFALLGKYEATPTVYGDGDAVPLAVDASGKLQVDCEITIPSVMDVNVTNGAAGAAVNIQDGGNSITVDAVNLDIRDIVNTQDSIAIGDATNIFDVAVLNSALSGTANAFPIAGRYQVTPDTFADGDATQILTDENGRLQVDVISGGGGANIKVDDSAFAVGTDSVGAVGYMYDATPDSVDDGDIGIARMTADRRVITTINDGTDELGVVKDGDAYSASTGGVLVVGQNGTTDYQALKVDSAGALYVNVGRPGSLTEFSNSVNAVKDTPATAATLTPGATIEVLGVTYAGSGKAQVDIYYGTTSSEVRKHTFYTSSASPNVDFKFPSELTLTTADTIYVSVTNLEKVASPQSDFTAYATISYVTV